MRPKTRILAGGLALIACLVIPLGSLPGALALAGVAVAWLAVCRPPPRPVVASLLFGLFALGPLVPLSAWLEDAAGLEAALRALARGLAGLLVTSSTFAGLDAPELHAGLGRLPLPGVVRAILQQIARQLPILAAETRGIAAALAVRGGTGGGRAALRLLAALPQVWLPRLLARAERVARAMQLRGPP